MYNEFLNIRTILNIDRWQQIQDQLARVTGLAIVTVDYKGEPVTQHSGRSSYCEIIRSMPKLHKKCQKCDARGGIEAARLNDIYMYRCHSDIIDVAAPIVIGDKYIGAIMMGQVLIDEEASKEYEYLERICTKSKKDEEDLRDLQKYYNELPKMPYETIKEKVMMINDISNYIVTEAIKKYTLKQENDKLNEKLEVHISAGKVDNNYNIRRSYESDSIINPSEKSILDPVIDYMNENLHQNLTLREAAKMCFISPSYFSKIFYEEIGENFSSYRTTLKMNQAKTMLRTTDKLIKQIALDLGFNDDSYFTKQFKSYEGITPRQYRKNISRNTFNHKKII